MKQHNFHTAMEKGVAYLYSIQEKNGSFLSLSSSDSNLFKNKIFYHTTFSTSLILSSSHEINESAKLKIIKQKAAAFLLKQKSTHWSWNYWLRKSKESKQMPYPDDLDDTFCALNALFLYNPKLIDGKSFSYIVRLLTLLEIKEGGPYRTWLIDKNAEKLWLDVDLAVNSNIAYFLSLNEIDIPNLSLFIEKHIVKKNFISPYYPSPFPIIYFISRFYKNSSKEKLITFLLSKKEKNGSFGNPLQSALVVSSLLNLSYPSTKLESTIAYLLKNQKDGHWQAYGFCFDPSLKGEKFVSGSEALTTVFCLEALSKYVNATAKIEKITSFTKIELLKQEKIYNKILENVRQRISVFDKTFAILTFSLINTLTKNNTDKQIPLLPYYFAHSLNKNKKIISEKLLIQLGTANVFGWIAYTVYDNFFDDTGDPKTLAVANVSLREATKLFSNVLPKNKKIQIFFQKIFDQLDAANYWEVKNCRNKNMLPDYKNYEKLAEKSFGHALGPLVILFCLGYNENSPDVKQLSKFFRHYLIAKQLNDDAHDWETDLKMHHINPVAALLLKKSSTKTSLKKLQKLFWETVVDDVCLSVRHHVNKGKKALNRCSLISDKLLFENMILKYEKIAIKTIEEKNQTMKFLRSYHE